MSFRGRGRGRGGGARGRGGPRGFRGGGRGGGHFDQGPPDNVIEVASLSHTVEDDLVLKSNTEKVPKFNSAVYLKNKQKVGNVDEIFGNIRDHSFTVKLVEGTKASSFDPKQTFYMDPYQLMPVERFLPGYKPPPRGARGARGQRGGMQRGGRGSFDRGRGRGGFTPGGAGGGDNKCFKCGESGHFSRECPQGGGTPGGGDNKCFKCGESGHFSRECPQGGGTPGGDNKCFKCGESGHFSRECPRGGFRGGRGDRRGGGRGFNRGGFDRGAKRFSEGGSGGGTPQNKKIKFDD